MIQPSPPITSKRDIGHLVFRSHADITPLCARTKWFLVGNSSTQVQMSPQKRPLVSPTKLQRLISRKWNPRVDSSSPACRPKSSKYSRFTFFKSSKNTHCVSSVKGKRWRENQARPFYVKRLELMKISINDSSSGIHWSLEEKRGKKENKNLFWQSIFLLYPGLYRPFWVKLLTFRVPFINRRKTQQISQPRMKLLMEEIRLASLRLVASPIVYRVFYINSKNANTQ